MKDLGEPSVVTPLQTALTLRLIDYAMASKRFFAAKTALLSLGIAGASLLFAPIRPQLVPYRSSVFQVNGRHLRINALVPAGWADRELIYRVRRPFRNEIASVELVPSMHLNKLAALLPAGLSRLFSRSNENGAELVIAVLAPPDSNLRVPRGSKSSSGMQAREAVAARPGAPGFIRVMTSQMCVTYQRSNLREFNATYGEIRRSVCIQDCP